MKCSRPVMTLAFLVLAGTTALWTVSAQDEPTVTDYELPTSSYEGVTVAHPNGDLPGEVAIQLVKVADGFYDPVDVTSANDGSGRLFVVERVGYIRIVEPDGTVLADPFLDIRALVQSGFFEQGLLGLAFHPDYPTNGLFYVNYADGRTNGDMFITEFTVSAEDSNVADRDSGRVLLSQEKPFREHNAGTISFGPDGFLYIAVGDSGLAGDPYDAAQNLNDSLGSILRIDVDAAGDGGYAIPDDNPFAGPNGLTTNDDYLESGTIISDQAIQIGGTGVYRPGAAPEIWHYGLRNPWQFSFDSSTGDMYLPDVGQYSWEEINFVSAGSPGGLNFGWDFMEGGHCFPPPPSNAESAGDISNEALYGVTSGCSVVGMPPVAEYSHEFGCAVIGLGVYRGTEFTSLDGIYFNSDFCSGRLWGLAMDDNGAWQFEELLNTSLQATGSGMGELGEVYMTTCACESGNQFDPTAAPNGGVWRLVAADQVPEGAETAPLE